MLNPFRELRKWFYQKKVRKDYPSDEELILTVLKDGPLYGYRIMKSIEIITNGNVRIGIAALYVTLFTLSRKGLIRRSHTTLGVGGTARQYWELTKHD